ncbi:hypothetical protein CAOG_06951 [Capsaspora owczarzaki ATCC 30864]|uniref:Membrane-associated protein n=1 Tax=Capsaspora owczarzaki (strain ATCC 30864) TaxID=595528 RepID=A0A0D2X4U4_CAPO3|nr:hypothetical protein CAOG_06951 [Capsaspora owczarzaki ATCC 30864]KJE96664.1 hypothetical protein CAOG_006951 [Capsaspora owczarzaki ATCC 30864]|eukprot:XP_004343675.1 hypothetical protein CAOG_06951 [Capsaspora owczarzaki ATCC 30864]
MRLPATSRSSPAAASAPPSTMMLMMMMMLVLMLSPLLLVSADRRIVASMECSSSLAVVRSIGLPNPDSADAANADAANTMGGDLITSFWSSLGSAPSLAVAYHPNASDPGTVPTIDCDALARFDAAKAITFGTQPSFMSAVVIDKLIEFDDKGQTGLYDPPSTRTCSVLDLTSLTWESQLTVPKNKPFTTTAVASYLSKYTNITVQFTVTPSTFRNGNPPGDLISENAVKIDLFVSNFTYTKSCSNTTKLAAGLVFADGNGPVATPNQLVMSAPSSIDDEYTPTIFHMVQIDVPPAKVYPQSTHGFLSWKPIAFTDTGRSIANGGFARTINDEFNPFNPNDTLPQSVPSLLLDGRLRDLRTANISFGTPEDGIYQPPVLLWGLSIGIGAAPTDDISVAVLLAISFGFGVPGVLLIVGSIITFFRRARARRSGYTAIN